MVHIYSKALDKTLKTGRIISHIKGIAPGPTLIFIAGIHGNEPSGVFALHRVLNTISEDSILVKGSIYAIAGNLSALEIGIRYHNKDLNRMWADDQANLWSRKSAQPQKEVYLEQTEIYSTISEILERENGPFYFVDLHTTSSPTQPFITVNDTLLNRYFTRQYPVPLLLGIEEYLEGTLLNYINKLGYVAFGFESGQHDALSSIENHVAFVYLTLVFSGNIRKIDIDYDSYYNLLTNATKGLESTYEIVSHYKIKHGEDFLTKPGFTNFKTVKKGQQIATSNTTPVFVPRKGNIFMPLYQEQGDDGFFVIRPIPAIFLSLSTFFRKIHIDRLLTLLPGISWVSQKRDALKVDLFVARFLAKKIFHLLGYRSRYIDSNHMVAKNRDATSKNKEYVFSDWYRK